MAGRGGLEVSDLQANRRLACQDDSGKKRAYPFTFLTHKNSSVQALLMLLLLSKPNCQQTAKNFMQG